MNKFIMLVADMGNEVKQIAIQSKDIDWVEQDVRGNAVLIHMTDGRIIKAFCTIAELLFGL